jgi:hypothetical protein
MNWLAVLQTVLVAALNALLGALVQHTTGSMGAAVGAFALGTAVAHALPSPFAQKDKKQ